jgi:formylmethanofuran dehydrogenase subunit A
MAGGIDVHSHIAGEPLELLRDAGNPIVPGVKRLGDEYARMGYTLVVNAAMPALAARRTIVEENAIPGLDTANLVWVGENPSLLDLAAHGSDAELDQYLSWLLSVSGARGLKLINPRSGADDGSCPAKKLIDRLIDACLRLELPHPLHLHHPFSAVWTHMRRSARRSNARRDDRCIWHTCSFTGMAGTKPERRSPKRKRSPRRSTRIKT